MLKKSDFWEWREKKHSCFFSQSFPFIWNWGLNGSRGLKITHKLEMKHSLDAGDIWLHLFIFSNCNCNCNFFIAAQNYILAYFFVSKNLKKARKSLFLLNYKSTKLNMGQVSKCFLQSSQLMNRGMLFSKKGKEEIPGCSANSAHSVTLFRLLWLCVRGKTVWIMPRSGKHGCVRVFITKVGNDVFSFETCFHLNQHMSFNGLTFWLPFDLPHIYQSTFVYYKLAG